MLTTGEQGHLSIVTQYNNKVKHFNTRKKIHIKIDFERINIKHLNYLYKNTDIHIGNYCHTVLVSFGQNKLVTH